MSQLLCLCRTDNKPISIPRWKQTLTQTDTTPALMAQQWFDDENTPSVAFALTHKAPATENPFSQPWTSTDPRQGTVADAQLYNRSELASKLCISRRPLSELPDTALIHKAYKKWGINCPQYLLGDFAFVIWDQRHQRLFCARDHTGARLLYFARKGKTLALATSASPLFGLLDLPRELNQRSTAELLAEIDNPEDSLFKHIHQLPAGHSLTVTPNGLHTQRYWIPEATTTLRLPKDEDYIEAFSELFENAVACRLPASSDAAILLSGGLDSSSVAAVAAPLLSARNAKLIAFTSVPRKGFQASDKNQLTNEGPLVEATAKWLTNLDVQFLHGGEFSPLQNMDAFLDMVETPMAAIQNRPWLEQAFKQAQRNGISVLLHGAMGNFTISWNGYSSLLDRLLQGHWVNLATELRALAKVQKTSALQLFKTHILRSLLPRQSLYLWRRLHKRPSQSWQERTFLHKKAIETYQLEQQAAKYFGTDPSIPWLNTRQWQWHWIKTLANHQSSEIWNGWRHQYGVTPRDPTADKRIVEFCLSLPGDQYLRNGQTRRLIRQTMRTRLPPKVLEETRDGNQSADWYETLTGLRTELRQELARARTSKGAQALIDLDRLDALVEHWPAFSDRGTRQTEINYRARLLRSIAAIHFIRWAETQHSEINNPSDESTIPIKS